VGNVAIRRFEPGDLRACRRLWAELAEWHRVLYRDPTIGAPDPGRLFDSHLEAVGPGHVWVAEADGELVGLAGMLSEGDTAELEPVAVTEAYRGRGVGRQLVDAVIAAARDEGAWRLSVRPTGRNAAAIRFFQSVGFGVLARVELQLDLDERDRGWRSGEQVAGREFLV
jgi:ribosomal protein S18 acetylase RimI-like enzyme